MEFMAILVSGDGQRTIRQEVDAVDIDAAASVAIHMIESGQYGAGAAWFVAGVLQTDYLYQVSSAVEAMI